MKRIAILVYLTSITCSINAQQLEVPIPKRYRLYYKEITENLNCDNAPFIVEEFTRGGRSAHNLNPYIIIFTTKGCREDINLLINDANTTNIIAKGITNSNPWIIVFETIKNTDKSCSLYYMTVDAEN